MAKQKPNLAAALAKKNEVEEIAPALAAPLTKRIPKERQANRADQANVSAWFPQNVKFTLEELRLKRQRELRRKVTHQEILGEAYNDLFKKYGLPEVAPVRED